MYFSYRECSLFSECKLISRHKGKSMLQLKLKETRTNDLNHDNSNKKA